MHKIHSNDLQINIPDGHGAKDVEKDERTIGHIRAHEVPVRQALKKKRELFFNLDAQYSTINCNHLLEAHRIGF